MLPFVTVRHFCVIDNASIHNHYDSRVALQHVFNGHYFFSARYSPHLKPIETCFAMIKSYIRLHESQAQLAPVQFIQSAFKLYSVTGPQGFECRGHFNGYFANHEHFGL